MDTTGTLEGSGQCLFGDEGRFGSVRKHSPDRGGMVWTSHSRMWESSSIVGALAKDSGAGWMSAVGDTGSGPPRAPTSWEKE